MTENCLVRVHQEMDERENSLHVVRGERCSFISVCADGCGVAQRQAIDSDYNTFLKQCSVFVRKKKHAGHAVK